MLSQAPTVWQISSGSAGPVETTYVSDDHSVALYRQIITPGLASTWLADYHYSRQRAVYPGMVKLYTDEMNNGTWKLSTIMLCDYTGPVTPSLAPGTYLMNGSHRLQALIAHGGAQTFLIEHHTTTNAEVVHELYQVQDRGRTRSVADIFRAIGLDEELGVPLSELRDLAEAQMLIANEFVASKSWLTDPFAKAAFVRDWLPEGQLWRRLTSHVRTGVRGRFQTSVVTAIGIYILRHQPEKGLVFWRDVCADDGLKQGMPAKTTHDWIVDNRVHDMSRFEYCQSIASGWNAHFIGNPLSHISLKQPAPPINIVGTPLATRKVQRRKLVSDRAGDELNDGV